MLEKLRIPCIGVRNSCEILARNSDFITLHAVSTDENDNLMNEERINSMKKTAFLINTAKGSLVDYDALEKAIDEKKIAGAALDVVVVDVMSEVTDTLEAGLDFLGDF